MVLPAFEPGPFSGSGPASHAPLSVWISVAIELINSPSPAFTSASLGVICGQISGGWRVAGGGWRRSFDDSDGLQKLTFKTIATIERGLAIDVDSKVGNQFA
jgi:hypothetical protein